MPFMISGKRNNAKLLSLESARSCPKCGIYTHRWEDFSDTSEPIDKDYSRTQDGFQVVSDKFKSIIDNAGIRNIDFLPLSNGMYVFRPQEVVFLDVSEALERVMGPCDQCGRFTAFLGMPPAAKLLSGQRRMGLVSIVRAGQAFGSDDFFIEDSIFGDEIFEELNDEGLRGGVTWNVIE